MDIVTPISPEYKKLLRDNPELSNLKDFFSDYINTIISEENKNNQFVTKEDFLLFEGYFNNLVKYYLILKNKGIEINNLRLIEKIILGQTKEEFKNFIKDEDIVFLLTNANENNLDKLLNLFNIQDKNNLKILAKDIDIIQLLAYANEDNFYKLFELEDFNNIKDLKILAKDSNIKYLLKYAKKHNLNKVWNLFNIKTKEDLIELAKEKDIVYLLEYAIEHNFNKIWNLYSIQNKNDLKKLAKDSNIVYLLEYVNENNFNQLFKLKDFNTKNDLKELTKNENIISLLKYTDENILNKIFDFKDFNTKDDLKQLAKNENIIYLLQHFNSNIFNQLLLIKKITTFKKLKSSINYFYQNMYIENDKILKGRYKSKEKGTILEFIKKYKNNISKNAYLGNILGKGVNQSYQPFSLIDLKVNNELTGIQERGKKHSIGKQDFFDINTKKEDITEEVQLAINRLFAPFFPMTRLLKIINGRIHYVSIDVENNEDGVKLNKFKNGISENIIKFFIMIYQFLTIDYDRNIGIRNHNLGKNLIIFDFDYIFDERRHLNFFDKIFDNKKDYNEMGEILYTLKAYLTNEVDELLKYYESKKQNDVVKIFKQLKTRLIMLNFSNLIYYNKQNHPQIEEFAYNLDKQYYVNEK